MNMPKVKYRLARHHFGPVTPMSLNPVDRCEVVAELVREDVNKRGSWDREMFYVLGLNVRNRPIMLELVSTGTTSQCLVHPREVFKGAIIIGATSIIIAHTHPSGDAYESEEDRAVTLRMEKAGILLGIPLLDHVVVTADSHRSVGGLKVSNGRLS